MQLLKVKGTKNHLQRNRVILYTSPIILLNIFFFHSQTFTLKPDIKNLMLEIIPADILQESCGYNRRQKHEVKQECDCRRSYDEHVSTT